ncbi:MAG: DNA polymerase I, partial [Candidatus Binataceae bacterium]
FGLEPRALVDVMALMGDAIDNVKGIPGVGEKTAAALIRHYGGIEQLYAGLDDIEKAGIRGAKKLGPLIAAHRGDVELARKLVRIDTDVPLAINPGDLTWAGVDEKSTAELLRELEFGSMLEELAPSQARIPQAAVPEITVEGDELKSALNQLNSTARVAFHLTRDENGADCLKIKAEGDSPTFHVKHDAIPETASFFAQPSPPKACHDLKEHLRELRHYGVRPNAVDFDTMLAGFLVRPGKPEPSLSDLYHEHLAPLGGNLAGSEPQIVAALREILDIKLAAADLSPLFHDVELPLASILAEIEETGIGIDAAALKAIADEFGATMTRLEGECFELAGRQFNLNSPIKLREILFDELKLPTKGLSKTKSGYSTDVDTLTRLAESHPLPRKLLEYRTLAKLKATYADALQNSIGATDGRLHTSFHQALTATGRLSSSNPNLQNIPTRSEEGRRIRRAFIAREGCLLLSGDYSQIELRVLAHLSGDTTLIEAFSHNEDIHVRTATEILGITPEAVDASARRLAKVINFGIIYGMGTQRLAGELGIALTAASDYIRRYFERLPGVRAWLDDCLKNARERGYVTTMYGRRRYLPELAGPQGGARAQAERIAINTPIQGSAADLMKIAMIRLHSALQRTKLQARIVMQIHDELLLEVEQSSVAPAGDLMRTTMEQVAELLVPLKIELKSGPNWAELTS